MVTGTRKIFPIEKLPENQDDNSVYGFPNRWSQDSIKEALTQNKNEMPRFILSKIEIHPSGHCNLNCKFCYGKKLAPGFEKRKNLPKRAIEDIFKDVEQNISTEGLLIILSGTYSEPLMNPEIKDIIKLIGDYGFRFGLYTNGLLINDETTDILLNAANKSENKKPSYISFNVSACFEVDKFRKVLLPIISALHRKRNREGLESRFDINAPFIIPRGASYDFLSGIVNDLRSVGVDTVRLSFPWVRIGEGSEKYKKASKKEYERLIGIFLELQRDFRVVRIRELQNTRQHECCYAMAMALSISPEGDVYPCPETSSPLFREKFSYGNILEMRLSEIWRSKKHLELFRSLNPSKEKCLCCPVYDEFNLLCNKYSQNK